MLKLDTLHFELSTVGDNFKQIPSAGKVISCFCSSGFSLQNIFSGHFLNFKIKNLQIWKFKKKLDYEIHQLILYSRHGPRYTEEYPLYYSLRNIFQH